MYHKAGIKYCYIYLRKKSIWGLFCSNTKPKCVGDQNIRGIWKIYQNSKQNYTIIWPLFFVHKIITGIKIAALRVLLFPNINFRFWFVSIVDCLISVVILRRGLHCTNVLIQAQYWTFYTFLFIVELTLYPSILSIVQ